MGLWRQKYGSILDKDWDWSFFHGGPCENNNAGAILFIPEAARFILDQYRIDVVLEEDGHILLYAGLEEIDVIVTAIQRRDRALLPKPTVFVFSGYAGWNKTQVMGEIGRRHWMLCRAKYVELQPF